MKQNYDESLRRVLAHEGGYTNDPRDPGGATNYGITIFDARAYWKHDATPTDVKAMPLSVAQQIYRSKYWDKMDCDDLPSGVDYAVFDFGVNSGISRSAKYLQGIVGAPTDGVIGPGTVLAVRAYVAAHSSADVITALCAKRLAFLQGLSTWDHFGKGWGQRVADVKIVALAMDKTQTKAAPIAPVPTHPAPPPKPAQPAPAPQPASGGFFVAIIRAVAALLSRK